MRQFGNPVFLVHKQKKVYENYHHYYGVLALRVRKSSRLKYEILGLIDALKKSNIAKVAQWLERSFHKRQVMGPSPIPGTRIKLLKIFAVKSNRRYGIINTIWLSRNKKLIRGE